MSKLFLALGVAALAISAPALADRDNDKGGQGGNKGGQSAKADHGGQAKAERRHDGGKAMRQAGNGGRGNDRMKGGDFRKAEYSRGDGRKDFARGKEKDDRVRVGNRDSRRFARDDDRRIDRDDDRRFDRDDRARIVHRNWDDNFNRGHGFDRCPPGLDKKDNGCLPPGQAKKFLGARIQNSFANNLVPYQYRRWYRDDDNHFYRAGDGFMYRVSRSNNLVDGIIPLFGGGSYYARGDQWPDPYNFYNVPYQYRSYYADSGDYNYRYGDGAIYRVNSGSGAVDSIVALLAGDLGVGTQLPTGYDAYNVPLSYRDRYYDTADNWYRYNDGYIYQVDPKTRLISAVIDAIV